MTDRGLLGKADALLARYRHYDAPDVPTLTEIAELPAADSAMPAAEFAAPAVEFSSAADFAAPAEMLTAPHATDQPTEVPVLTEVVELPSLLIEVATGVATERAIGDDAFTERASEDIVMSDELVVSEEAVPDDAVAPEAAVPDETVVPEETAVPEEVAAADAMSFNAPAHCEELDASAAPVSDEATPVQAFEPPTDTPESVLAAIEPPLPDTATPPPTGAVAPVLAPVPEPATNTEVPDDVTARVTALFDAELQNLERRIEQIIAEALRPAPHSALDGNIAGGEIIAARLRPALDTAIRAALDVVIERTCRDIAAEVAARVHAELAASLAERLRDSVQNELRAVRAQLPPPL